MRAVARAVNSEKEFLKKPKIANKGPNPGAEGLHEKRQTELPRKAKNTPEALPVPFKGKRRRQPDVATVEGVRRGGLPRMGRPTSSSEVAPRVSPPKFHRPFFRRRRTQGRADQPRASPSSRAKAAVTRSKFLSLRLARAASFKTLAPWPPAL